LNLCSERAAHRGEGNRYLNCAISRDRGLLGHAKINDVAAKLWIDDSAKNLDDVIGGGKLLGWWLHLCHELKSITWWEILESIEAL